MDPRTHQAGNRGRGWRRKYHELKQILADTSAELGWEKAQSAKKIRSLENQVGQCGEESDHLKLQVEILQRELEERTQENAVLAQKVQRLQRRMEEYAETNLSLQNSMVETRETLLGFCGQHAASTMVASVHNDQPIAELLNVLHGYVKTAKATLNARHKKKIQELQEAIHSKDQCNAELSKELDGYETVKALVPRLARLHETALEPSTIRALVDELDTNPLPSCGHLESGARSLTGCNILLCEACDREMQAEIITDHAVLQCHWCEACCSVIPLPKLFTLPRMSEWYKIVHQVEIVQGDRTS